MKKKKKCASKIIEIENSALPKLKAAFVALSGSKIYFNELQTWGIEYILRKLDDPIKGTGRVVETPAGVKVLKQGMSTNEWAARLYEMRQAGKKQRGRLKTAP